MQLVWAENVRRHTGRPVLIVTPLAVGPQTVREAEKFGIEAKLCRDGKHGGGIVVTNYERLHYFDPTDLAGVVCDESSILKNFLGVTRKAITEFLRRLRYRLLCTATAAPARAHHLRRRMAGPYRRDLPGAGRCWIAEFAEGGGTKRD
jgi:hypothetical protein